MALLVAIQPKVRQAGQFVGVLSLTGELGTFKNPINEVQPGFYSGALGLSGSVVGVVGGQSLVTVPQAVAGTLTPVGAVSSSVTTGVPLPIATKDLSGSLGLSGAVVGVVGGESLVTVPKSLSGGIGLAGSVAGSIVPTLTIVTKSLAGALGLSGGVVGVAGGPSLVTVTKSIGGTLGQSSGLATLAVAPPSTFFSQDLSATLSPTGTVSTQVGGPSLVTVPKQLTASLVPTSLLTTSVGGPSLVIVPKTVGGALVLSAAVANAVSGVTKVTKSLAATLGMSSVLGRVVGGGPPATGMPIRAGMFNLVRSDFGDAPGWLSTIYSPSPSTILSDMSAAKILGMICFVNLAGSRGNWTDANGNFDFTAFKAQLDRFVGINITQYAFDAVTAPDNPLMIYVIDEPWISTFNGTIPPNVRKQIFQEVKNRWPTIPRVFRSGIEHLTGSEMPSGGWGDLVTHAICQYGGPLHLPSAGETPQQFFTRQKAGCTPLGIKMIPGDNWLDGGDGSSGISGNNAGDSSSGTPANDNPNNRWMMSAVEIRAATTAAVNVAAADIPAFTTWTHVYSSFPKQIFLAFEQSAAYVSAWQDRISKCSSRNGTVNPPPPPPPPLGPFYTNTGFFAAPLAPTLNVGTALRDSLTNHKVFHLLDGGRTQAGEYSAFNIDHSLLYWITSGGVGTVSDVTWNIPSSIVQASNPRGAFGINAVVDGVVWDRTDRKTLYFVKAASGQLYQRDVVGQVTTLLKDFTADPTFSSFWQARSVTTQQIKGLHGDRMQDHLAALVVNPATSGVVGAVAWDRSDGRIWLYASSAGKVAVRVTVEDSGQYMKVVFSDASWENIELISNNFTQQLGVVSDAISPPTDDDTISLKMFQANGRGVYSRTFEPAQAAGTQVYAHPQRSAKLDLYSVAKVSMQSADDICYYAMYYGATVATPWQAVGGGVYSLDVAAERAALTYKLNPEVLRANRVQLTLVPFQTGGTPLAPVAPAPLRTRTANTAAELVNFAVNSLPGDLIQLLANTTYDISSTPITQTVSGTQANPITIRGAGVTSVVNIGSNRVWSPKAAWLRYENFRATNAFYAFFCGGATSGTGPGAPNVVFDQMTIDHCQQEGILLQHGTVGGYVQRSTFSELGISAAAFGEGVYVGGYGVASTDCKVLQNSFGPNVRAEAIDNSDGSDRTIIEGNTINCQTVSIVNQTNSPIGLRGNNVITRNNTIIGGAPNGIDIYNGTGHVVQGNTIQLNTAGVGIRRTGGTATVYCDNVVTNIQPGGVAYQGFTCTPGGPPTGPVALSQGQWSFDSTGNKAYARLAGDVSPASQVMSMFDWRFGHEEVVMVNQNGTLRGRLCHHFHYSDSADSNALGAAVSYDGSRVAFTSNWGGKATLGIYAALVDSSL